MIGATVLNLTAGSTAFAKPPGGGGGGNGGGGADQDLDVCIYLSEEGGVAADGPVPYCGSDRGITSFVGRNRSIWLELGDKPNQTRRLVLTLGDRLPWVPNDPNPNADGGVIFQSGDENDWSDHILPVIPAEGITGEFPVAYRENVLHQGEPGYEPNPMIRSGRLRWLDPDGRWWGLYWGPQINSGGDLWVNPNTVGVEVTRLTDPNTGELINEWYVGAMPDSGPNRFGTYTAFLWREDSPNGPSDYMGAFDIFFEYTAVAEP